MSDEKINFEFGKSAEDKEFVASERMHRVAKDFWKNKGVEVPELRIESVVFRSVNDDASLHVMDLDPDVLAQQWVVGLDTNEKKCLVRRFMDRSSYPPKPAVDEHYLVENSVEWLLDNASRSTGQDGVMTSSYADVIPTGVLEKRLIGEAAHGYVYYPADASGVGYEVADGVDRLMRMENISVILDEAHGFVFGRTWHVDGVWMREEFVLDRNFNMQARQFRAWEGAVQVVARIFRQEDLSETGMVMSLVELEQNENSHSLEYLSGVVSVPEDMLDTDYKEVVNQWLEWRPNITEGLGLVAVKDKNGMQFMVGMIRTMEM